MTIYATPLLISGKKYKHWGPSVDSGFESLADVKAALGTPDAESDVGSGSLLYDGVFFGPSLTGRRSDDELQAVEHWSDLRL